MQTQSEIKAMLTERGLAPRKSLGQNFLVDQNLIQKLVEVSGVGPGELVLEVGPGTGTLTEALLEHGCEVVACEMDRGLAALLRERLAWAGERFRLVEGDCLESKRSLNEGIVRAIGERPFVMVANLPYGAATPVISILLSDWGGCRGLFVTIQLEVAERLKARPGEKEYGTLSVVAQCVADVELIARLPPQCFWPAPDVTSAMVAIRRKSARACESVRDLAAFCQRLLERRRKQIGSVLGRGFEYPAGIVPENRAEDLSIEQLISLQRAVEQKK